VFKHSPRNDDNNNNDDDDDDDDDNDVCYNNTSIYDYITTTVVIVVVAARTDDQKVQVPPPYNDSTMGDVRVRRLRRTVRLSRPDGAHRVPGSTCLAAERRRDRLADHAVLGKHARP